MRSGRRTGCSPRLGAAWILGVWLSIVSSVSGCSTIYNPATQREEMVLDSSIEIALGKLARAQMGLLSLNVGRVSPDQMARVQTIGVKIAQVSDRHDVPYQFGVIRDKNWNAFAMPGGTIYVHTGLLTNATDDELAAVIAHEVGHVAARHVAKHLQADLGFSVLMEAAHAAGAGAQAARVANSLYDLLSRGFSRQDELEADRLAIRYSHRAGYNPAALLNFFDKLLAKYPEGPSAKTFVWQSTHPLTSDRIAQAKKELDTLEPELFCPTCGRTFGAQAQFCEYDGTRLKVKSRKP